MAAEAGTIGAGRGWRSGMERSTAGGRLMLLLTVALAGCGQGGGPAAPKPAPAPPELQWGEAINGLQAGWRSEALRPGRDRRPSCFSSFAMPEPSRSRS